MTILVTISGFLLAIIENFFVPRMEGESQAAVSAGTVSLTGDGLFRLLLCVLIVFYMGAGIFSLFREDRKSSYGKRAAFRFAMGIALGVWDLLGTKLSILPQPFFPGPAQIMEAFLTEGGYILENTLYSLRLFLAGFSLGVLFGIFTGVVIGWFPKVSYWVLPVLNVCGVIPAVAWMPFALTLFPTSFGAATFLIVVCVWFPVASMTALGIASTPKAQLEVARTLGGKTPYLLFRVAIPHAMPQVFTGITTADAFAFTTLVMAEMMGQPGGLGYYINASKVWSAYYKVFAAIIVMAVLFSVIMKITGCIEHRVLRWQKGTVK